MSTDDINFFSGAFHHSYCNASIHWFYFTLGHWWLNCNRRWSLLDGRFEPFSFPFLSRQTGQWRLWRGWELVTVLGLRQGAAGREKSFIDSGRLVFLVFPSGEEVTRFTFFFLSFFLENHQCWTSPPSLCIPLYVYVVLRECLNVRMSITLITIFMILILILFVGWSWYHYLISSGTLGQIKKMNN